MQYSDTFPNVSSQSIDTQRGTPLCICLQYVGDNGDCPVHGPAPRTHLNRTINLFPSDGDSFNVLYELAKREGDRRFGSACKHEQTKNGKCLNCWREVL